MKKINIRKMSLYENLKEEAVKNRNNSKEKSSKINKNLNPELKEKNIKMKKK